jgi:hypothetical protein
VQKSREKINAAEAKMAMARVLPARAKQQAAAASESAMVSGNI